MEQPTKKAIQINIERIDQTKYLLYVFDHPVYKANMTAVFQDIRKDLRSEFKLDIETATVLFYDETGEITKAVKAKSHAELKDIVDKLEIYIKNEKNYWVVKAWGQPRANCRSASQPAKNHAPKLRQIKKQH